MNHKKPLLGLIGLLTAGMIGQAAPAWANVYASGLNKTGDRSLSYILNESASAGVSVQVWQDGGGIVYSENLGSQAKGAHTWTWNGTGGTAGSTYKIKIVASSTGYSGWTKTSTDSTLNNFYGPRGVAVNNNQNSQYFGRIYVSQGQGGTTGAGRATQDGIYMLNADMSDAIGQGNTAKTGGVAWASTNSSSPFRVEVGADNNVYVCDWSDAHSGLWMADPNFSSAKEILDSTGRNTAGLNTTHGSISGFIVEGTGADRKIYTTDEDMYKTGTAGLGSIWRYDIGTKSVFTGAPTGVLYDDYASNVIQNYTNDLIHANDGTWWLSQTRGGAVGETLSSLVQISADGKKVLWTSVPSLAADSANDPLKRIYGIAYDSVHNLMALATYNAGKVVIFNPTTKSVVTTFSTGASSTNRDVAFDAAGNLYVVDNWNERMWAWSPGGGANSYTTQSWFSFNAVPEPASIVALLVGLPGLYMIRRRRR